MGEDELKHKAEALLFASGRALDIEAMAELAECKIPELEKALIALRGDYDSRQSALFIWNEGVRWKINVKEDYAPLVKSITAETELTRPVMATLALVAYRNPVLQAEVIKSRGDGAYAHIAELVDKDFVTKEKMGRSFKLKVTDKFYNYFDVDGDKDIREALAEAKPKEVKAPDKLGELDVVEAETDFEAEMESRKKDTQMQIYGIEEQRENDKGFLNEFDGRLDGVKKNVDVTEAELDEHKASVDFDEDEHKPEEEEDPEAMVRAVEAEIKALTGDTSETPQVEAEEKVEEEVGVSTDSEQSAPDTEEKAPAQEQDTDEEEKPQEKSSKEQDEKQNT